MRFSTTENEMLLGGNNRRGILKNKRSLKCDITLLAACKIEISSSQRRKFEFRVGQAF